LCAETGTKVASKEVEVRSTRFGAIPLPA